MSNHSYYNQSINLILYLYFIEYFRSYKLFCYLDNILKVLTSAENVNNTDNDADYCPKLPKKSRKVTVPPPAVAARPKRSVRAQHV